MLYVQIKDFDLLLKSQKDISDRIRWFMNHFDKVTTTHGVGPEAFDAVKVLWMPILKDSNAQAGTSQSDNLEIGQSDSSPEEWMGSSPSLLGDYEPEGTSG